MKQKSFLALMAIFILLLTAACTTGSPTALVGGETELSQQMTLALGTLQLETTDLAIDETEAAELLPLWQTLQNLSSNDATAAAELEAIVKQIERTMLAEQVTAIQVMDLTSESLGEVMAAGGFGGPPNGGIAAGDTQTRGQGGGFAGGPPGGGFPGGGPPDGGAGGVGFDPSAIETRQAERASGTVGNFQDGFAINAVIRLLQQKTGTAVPRPQQVAIETVSEALGLTVDELMGQFAEGQTMADIITAHDGDVEEIKNGLTAALEDAYPDMDGAQFAAEWLGLGESDE